MMDTVVPEQDFSIGRILQEARVLQGASLDEAARVTRIAKRYLVALEEDAFEKLPSETHAKGFLRAYAIFLGLPPDELLGHFQGNIPGEVPVEKEHTSDASRSDRDVRGKGMRWLSVFAAIGLITVLAVLLRGGADKKVDSTSVVPQSSPVTEYAFPSPVQLPFSSERKPDNSAAAAAEPKVSATEVPTAVNGVILRIKALEDGSLDLTIDEAISQHYDLKAGDLIEWKAEKVFFLELENSGGVEAVLNGKQLKPFGRKGTPAHVVLSAEYDGENTNY